MIEHLLIAFLFLNCSFIPWAMNEPFRLEEWVATLPRAAPKRLALG
jgi:hypothetical protein